MKEQNGIFTVRPPVGCQVSRNGETFVVAATWPGGVVFQDCEFVVSAARLVRDYQPLPQCEAAA